jgi:hypothetical protein
MTLILPLDVQKKLLYNCVILQQETTTTMAKDPKEENPWNKEKLLDGLPSEAKQAVLAILNGDVKVSMDDDDGGDKMSMSDMSPVQLACLASMRENDQKNGVKALTVLVAAACFIGTLFWVSHILLPAIAVLMTATE